jgi:2-iminoacetate synthase ThiH
VVQVIRSAGFTPVQRNTLYEPLRIFERNAA